MRIDTVVFDIGNVLLHWDPDGHYDRTIGPERRAALYAAVDLHGMNLRSDRGEHLGELVEDYAARHPDYAGEIRRYWTDWLQMAAPDIPETARMLRALKARGMPVVALSNFGRETLARAEVAYPVLTEFDRRFVSGELGVMKPEPEIFRMVEAETGVPPEHLLFIDDSRANVDAAAARGWQVHLFDGPEGLARRLVDLGLLTQAEV